MGLAISSLARFSYKPQKASSDGSVIKEAAFLHVRRVESRTSNVIYTASDFLTLQVLQTILTSFVFQVTLPGSAVFGKAVIWHRLLALCNGKNCGN